MRAVCEAREAHDNGGCPWGGKATAVHLSWFDVERLGWEDGDLICGLVVVGDETVPTGRMRVTCDAEPGGGRREEEGEEIVEAGAGPRGLIEGWAGRPTRAQDGDAEPRAFARPAP